MLPDQLGVKRFVRRGLAAKEAGGEEIDVVQVQFDASDQVASPVENNILKWEAISSECVEKKRPIFS